MMNAQVVEKNSVGWSVVLFVVVFVLTLLSVNALYASRWLHIDGILLQLDIVAGSLMWLLFSIIVAVIVYTRAEQHMMTITTPMMTASVLAQVIFVIYILTMPMAIIAHITIIVVLYSIAWLCIKVMSKQ